MATCIHVLGSVYALQSEYDLVCLQYSDQSLIFIVFAWYFVKSYYVQLHVVLLVKLNLLIFAHVCTFTFIQDTRNATWICQTGNGIKSCLSHFLRVLQCCWFMLWCSGLSHSVVDIYQHSREHTIPEDGDSMCLWNCGIHLPCDCSL